MMKVLFVCSDFPNPWRETKGVFNLNLARALAARHDVRVIAPIAWTEELSARLHGRGAATTAHGNNFEGIQIAHPRYYYPPGVMYARDWFYWYSVRSAAVRMLGQFLPDLVLSYWVHPDGAVANRIARRAGVPSGVIVGGSDVMVEARRRRRRASIVRTLNEVDLILTVNRDLRERVAALGIDPEKVHVWHQGVDGSLFCPGDKLQARQRLGLPQHEKVLLWVGRMHPIKGLDVLIDAGAELRDRAQSFRLYLVGDGPLRKMLAKEVADRGLTDLVTFVGSLPPERLPDWYRAADLTVLSSRSERLPNVLRESLACGTRFVASDVGGISEIARAKVDRLVPPGDPAALADAIIDVLQREREPESPTFTTTSWGESAENLVRIVSPYVERSKARRGWQSATPDHGTGMNAVQSCRTVS